MRGPFLWGGRKSKLVEDRYIVLFGAARDDLRYQPVSLSESTRSSSCFECRLKLYLALRQWTVESE